MGYKMKRYLLLFILLFHIMPLFSQIKVEDVKAFKHFAFSAYSPSEAYKYFVNPTKYNYSDSLIQLSEQDIETFDYLLNNELFKIKIYGHDLSIPLGMGMYASFVVRIDSIEHFFTIRSRSILTEILKGNKRIDHIFLEEQQKMALGNLAMKYSSVGKNFEYKNPVEIPVSIDQIRCYSHSWNNIKSRDMTFFFENPEKYLENTTLLQVDEQDVEIFESILNHSKVKKHLNRFFESSWERNSLKVLPIVVTVNSLEHNFVLTQTGEIIELVDGGEVFYFFQENQKQFFYDFIEKYSFASDIY